MLRLRVDKRYINHAKAIGLTYHPDFIVYDLGEKEYQQFWQSINTHPRTQLYTDGIQIIRVSWIQSVFQTIKGWFGFDNHCQANKIEITLAKIAFHGYLKGYHPPEYNEHRDPIVSQQFQSLSRLERSNQRTAQIQQLMLNYYITFADYFPRSELAVHSSHRFGQTLNSQWLYQLIPAIDAQDPQVISDSILGMQTLQSSANILDCFPSSSFAISYANYLLNQGKYYAALEWDQQIETKNKERYINFYLSQRNKDQQALKKAITVIEQLGLSANSNDQIMAINYLKQNFSHTEQLHYLANNPALRKKLAKSYLEEAILEKNKFAVTKLILGNQVIPLLTQAMKLDPQLDIHDAALKEEWAHHLFNASIKHKRFSEARALFEQNSGLTFNKKNLSILRTNYLDEIEEKKMDLKNALTSRNISIVESIALELLEIAKKIARISPVDNPLINLRIDYAATLLAIDKIQNPAAAHADLDRLNKAQAILNEHYLLHKSIHLKELINEVLLRKIDCLIERVNGPTGFGTSWSARKECAEAHQTELDVLQSDLKRYIALNQEDKAINTRTLVAKMHYILGDILVFFLDNKMHAIPHFSKASDMMPKNPYYQYRYFELIDSDKKNKVWETICSLTTTNNVDYGGWLEERWDAGEKSISRGFEIHDVKVEPKGVFSFLF